MATLPVFAHNHLSNTQYLVFCEQTRDCCVIDPFNAQDLIDTAARHDLKITQILNTHEHADHTHGNLALKEKTDAVIRAHHQAADLIPGFDHGLSGKDILTIGKTVTLEVLETPGHTPYSLCFHDKTHQAVYTGDTLFHCGCGNCLHGGNLNQLFETFEEVLQFLPDETKVYPGHNTIKKNLSFVRSLDFKESEVEALEQSIQDEEAYISTIAQEKNLNPFFQVDNSTLKKSIGLPASASRETVFQSLRALRNNW